jgi:DNA/RNA-binding domain of Phe-tRNA-synthetase-like protein
MVHFQYDTSILARYPNTCGGVIVANGLANAPTPDDLQVQYVAEQQAVLARIGNTPLSEIASLSAWRGVFRGFGVDPTQYRSAAESLLRRLTKQGNIPTINTLVDIGNLVSIRYALPVAVFDVQQVTGTITVRFAAGDERFTPLGESTPEQPETGEVIFADNAGLVLARRWCWRQSDQSAARDRTTNAIITVEAHHAQGRADVTAALHNLQTLLTTFAGAAADAAWPSAVLDSTQMAI